jgi:hypothetical protein
LQRVEGLKFRIPQWALIFLVGVIALAWWSLSVAASILTWNEPFGGIWRGEYRTLTIYYTDVAFFMFFPTYLTFPIIGQPAAGYYEDMVVHHRFSIPIYFITCYVAYLILTVIYQSLQSIS